MEIKNIEIQDSDGNVFYPHTNASVVKATDTSGLDGIAGKSSDTQTLLDKLADRVANKLIEKGMIANNLVTDNENMVLAAPMGKKLQEQISDVNNNINSIIEVIRVDILNYIKTNFISMKSRTIRGFECSNAPVEGGNDFIYYIDTINDINFTSVIAIDVRTNCVYRNNMIGGNWIGWDKFILNSDIGNIIFKRIESEQISNANDAPFGLSVISPLGSNNPFNFWATLITTGQELYSQQIALPWSNLDRPKYRVKDGGTWHDWTNMYG